MKGVQWLYLKDEQARNLTHGDSFTERGETVV